MRYLFEAVMATAVALTLTGLVWAMVHAAKHHGQATERIGKARL